MRDLTYALSPTYQIPSRHRIADDLLDEAYNGLREEVLKELRKTEFLNVTVDETTNIRSQRVIVMTITTPTSYCTVSFVTGTISSDSQNLRNIFH